MKSAYLKDAATVYAAAVLTKSGNVYAAAQYFSDTYSLTLHGEQCALVHAAAHGEGEITAMACLSNEKLQKDNLPILATCANSFSMKVSAGQNYP